MKADLSDQLRALMEHGVSAVSAAEATDSAGAARPAVLSGPGRPQPGRRRLAAAGAGFAAIAAACAIAVAQLAGPAVQPQARHGQRNLVLTAAMVRHVVAATRLALAHSGRAVISSSDTVNGKPQGGGTDYITFAGKNWNLLTRFPRGTEGAERYVINRVVNGKAYDYFIANHGWTWYHVTGPTAVSSMRIPDPRLLLGELEPTARFVVAGHGTIDGVHVTALSASRPRVIKLPNLPDVVPSGQLTALTVWVDGQGVARRIAMTASQKQTGFTFSHLKPAQFGKHVKILRIHRNWHGRPAIQIVVRLVHGHKERIVRVWAAGAGKAVAQTEIGTVTVTFTDIGKPEVIRAPRHFFTVPGLG
jgi:hypothetical protein